MEKRPVIFIVLAWLLILSSIYVIVLTISNFKFFFYHLFYVYKLPLRVVVMIYYILEVAHIAAGVLILKLKESGRRLILVLAVLDIFVKIFGAYFYSEIESFNLLRTLFDLLFPIFYIFYFNRLSIRNLFRQ